MTLFHLRPQLRAIRATLPSESLRTRRACDWSRVRVALRESSKAKKRVRVYAGAGFVPNSYKYRCEIQFIELRVNNGRVVDIGTGWTGAQRSRGAGSLIVVQ